MSLINMLSWWQWSILAAVPPAIVALYFLKLKRQPLEVPSTYLWHRTIEDLHVNSLWQRLRQSLLLFLQLLLIALAMLACLRPGWRGASLSGERFIFLIDQSASASATDISPSRLDEAKKQVTGIIDQMKSGDVAMIVSFSDSARVRQPFTDNRRALRRALAEIEPTNRTSNLGEALRVSAGLANPGRSGERDSNDQVVAEPLPATLYIVTDGGFPPVQNFSMGNLEPKYMKLGVDSPNNVGIVAFSAERNAEKADQLQAFARLENYGPEDVTVEVSLYLSGEMVNAAAVEVPTGGSGGVDFPLGEMESGTLKLQIDDRDDLMLDNTAYLAINDPRRVKVLVVTPQNDALDLALGTEQVAKVAELSWATPDFLTKERYQKQAAAGAYDLVIFDQCAPEKMPQTNTLFIGRLPPSPQWSADEKSSVPQIIDTDRMHPLMQFVEMGDVGLIAEATPLKPPAGATVLIDGDAGPLLAIAPREGFEDAVLGFELEGFDEESKQRYYNTDWPRRLSFPVFAKNVLEYLAGAGQALSTGTVKPGRPMTVRTSMQVDEITVEAPSGAKTKVLRQAESAFIYAGTDELGIYNVRAGDSTRVAQRFSVNLFDSSESDIKPKAEIYSGYETIPGESGWEPVRREAWKFLLLLGLGVLLLEWYIFNRRVYL